MQYLFRSIYYLIQLIPVIRTNCSVLLSSNFADARNIRVKNSCVKLKKKNTNECIEENWLKMFCYSVGS